MSKKTKLALFLSVVISAAVAVLGILMIHDDGLNWLSWKDNTYPHKDTFTIKDEGEYGWFGSIKIGYDIPVRAGQYVCVAVGGDNQNYYWTAFIYLHHTETGAIGMVTTGPYNTIPTGGQRCYEVKPLWRVGEGLLTEFVLHKVHLFGEGRGGVTARPVVVVSDESLERRLLPARVEP